MVVGQPGDHCHPTEIDEFRVRACEPAYRIVGTDSSELIASDRNGLRVGEVVVDGHDLGVEVDDVRRRSATSLLTLRRQCGCEDEGQGGGRDDQLHFHRASLYLLFVAYFQRVPDRISAVPG